MRNVNIKTGRARRPRAFTLIELLVVVTIVILVSAVALAVVPGLTGNYQINEGARILQSAFAGARDAAIRASAPRGFRMLPDPSLTDGVGPADLRLVFNRLIPIEPAPDLSEGEATFVPDTVPPTLIPVSLTKSYMTWFWTNTDPPRYAVKQFHNFIQPPVPPAAPSASGYSIQGVVPIKNVYPYFTPQQIVAAGNDVNGIPYLKNHVLMVVESKFKSNETSGGGVPNSPTNWFWNVRIGDKIRMNDSGQYYTVVGPMSVVNPELFVNIGNPGATVANTDSLTVNYTDSTSTTLTVYPEFLFLVNARDDDGNGFVDDGYNNVDENLDGLQDDLGEWFGVANTPTANASFSVDSEVWSGYEATATHVNPALWSNPPSLSYTIVRRPVPSPGAREILLPSSVVIDMTTWNTTKERSRLPDPQNGVIDILLNPSGQLIPTTIYSTPAATGLKESSFFHFWISDRSDVYTSIPYYDPTTKLPVYPWLPLPESTLNYPPSYNTGLTGLFLKKDRQLVTFYTRSGQVLSNTINNFQLLDPTTSPATPADPDRPYFEAQQGIREAK